MPTVNYGSQDYESVGRAFESLQAHHNKNSHLELNLGGFFYSGCLAIAY